MGDSVPVGLVLVLPTHPNRSGVHPATRDLTESRETVPAVALHIVDALAGADLKGEGKGHGALGLDFEWFALLFHCAYSLTDDADKSKKNIIIL